MRLDENTRAFIGSGVNATLVTLNPDGSPQVSVVWMELQSGPEGDELVSAHLSAYKKVRNMQRDGRVAVTILGTDRGSEMVSPYLAITGTARIEAGGAGPVLSRLADALAPEFHGQFPPPGAPDGFVTRIRIEKVAGVGPWGQLP